MRIRALPILAVTSLLVIIIASCASAKSSSTAAGRGSTLHPAASTSTTPVILRIGDSAPNFTLSTLAGDKNVSLSDYHAKPVLLFFWTLSCSVCLQKAVELQQLYSDQRGAHNDFTILSVNLDQSCDFVKVAQFESQHNLTYPILVDDHYQARNRYNVTTLPAAFFIDRRGIILSIIVGTFDNATLRKDVAQIEL